MDWYTYFPSVIYREEHPEWVEPTLRAAQKYYDSARSNTPLLQTDYMANDPELKFLADYLINASVEILRGQGYDVDKYVFYLSGLWGQDVKCNGGTNVHVHKNSQISGWFFLETPEGGSYPVFFDPRMNKAMIELDYMPNSEVTNATGAVHFNNVRPGTAMFANSWLQHQLTQNNAHAETKSIHFIVSHRDKDH